MREDSATGLPSNAETQSAAGEEAISKRSAPASMRPLSAKLLAPTIPELEGRLDREKLLDISGRARDRQIALAAELGVTDYPSPAGGCKLTEEGFCRKLKDLKDHEGLANRRLVELLVVGRRFRLPDGSSVILGRNRDENAVLSAEKGAVIAIDGVPGPTALVPVVKSDADLELARGIVRAWSRGGTGREQYHSFQIV